MNTPQPKDCAACVVLNQCPQLSIVKNIKIKLRILHALAVDIKTNPSEWIDLIDTNIPIQ